MMRVVGVELRRSAAPATAVALLVIGTVLMFFAEGIGFAAGRMQIAMTQRLYLAILWPLALAAGAWQTRRESRSKVAELFATTPRPRMQRVVPTISAMAVAVVCGYLAMSVAPLLWIAGTARYLPMAFFVVTAVGVLALIAAVWLGQAVGRLLPWPVTPPLLAVAGLAFLLLIPGWTRPRGWLALVFSPIYEMNMPDAYATVPGRASAAQAIWLGALAVAALMLLVGDWRLRTAALLPAVLGAVLAIGVMPHQSRVVIGAVDRAAKELVCADGEPVVCVSRVHAGLLPEVATRARAGLAIVAKMPGAPTRVHEDTTTYYPDVYPEWHDDVALLSIDVGPDGHLRDTADVAADVAVAAFASPPACEKSVSFRERLAAAYWLVGREPKPDPEVVGADPAPFTEAANLLRDLRQLPAGDAMARVAKLRQAAITCSAEDGMLTRGAR
ncbi:hypothetical protein [Actinoplanes sp. NPDC049265]|uniref:hypothetical protein n=1 Tax=Actinoplanes sp. NPDC049265 TaxID=3363902 RepID=UPI00371E725F